MSQVRQDVVVPTSAGHLRGEWVDGIASFKGIPYAAPPFGPNRFLAPKPALQWDGVRDALTPGPIAPQAPYPPPLYSLLGDQGVVGEECLNLNVWTREPSAGARLPVMVWIPGGAFTRGAGSLPVYDGSRFARDGVVCVTINYRLGIDGFLLLRDVVPNRGLLDQLAALHWVRENISAFGGEPDNVTVFGESAGGFSVGTLLAMPASRGLFRRAILQSGAAHHSISVATAELVRKNVGQAFGVEPTVASMSAIPIPDLIATQTRLAAEQLSSLNPSRWGETALNGMMFEPIVDGETLPGRPIDLIRDGATRGIDVMAGNTSEEWRFFTVPLGLLDMIGEPQLELFTAAYGLNPKVALPIYRSARPGASPGDLYAAVVTDWFFRIPAVRLAEAHAATGGQAYVYEFAWRSPLFQRKLGACHALELGFVFDNLDKSGPMSAESGPQALAEVMHHHWVSFARDGNPGWPAYAAARRPVMVYSGESGAVVDDPASAERRLWEGVR